MTWSRWARRSGGDLTGGRFAVCYDLSDGQSRPLQHPTAFLAPIPMPLPSTYCLALSDALTKGEVGAVKALVDQAVGDNIKAVFFGAPTPGEYIDLLTAANDSAYYCRADAVRTLLKAGLPVETVLRETETRWLYETMLVAATFGYSGWSGPAAKLELIDLLLTAGANPSRIIPGSVYFRYRAPLTSSIKKSAIARAFMKHGVPAEAFKGMRRDYRARLSIQNGPAAADNSASTRHPVH